MPAPRPDVFPESSGKRFLIDKAEFKAHPILSSNYGIYWDNIPGKASQPWAYNGSSYIRLAKGKDLDYLADYVDALEMSLTQTPAEIEEEILQLEARIQDIQDEALACKGLFTGTQLEKKTWQLEMSLEGLQNHFKAKHGVLKLATKRAEKEAAFQSLKTEVEDKSGVLDRTLAESSSTLMDKIDKLAEEAKLDMDALTAEVRQTQRDAELLWELHRRAEHLGDKTFLTTNFKRFYVKSNAAKTPAEFWDVNCEMLAHFYEKKGFSAVAASKAQEFVNDLKSDVEQSPSNAPSAWLPAWIATRCWTSLLKDPVLDREWCGLLNEMVRGDDVDLMPKVCVVTATMAGYNVSDRNAALPAIEWPKRTEGDQIAWTLTRGGRMPDEHLQWYESRVGQTIRIPSNFATTKDTSKSKDFMNNFSYPTTAPKVMFYLELHELGLCKHVNCLESLTLAPAEQEFLFPPYSCFKIKKVEHDGAIVKITLVVVSDNTNEPEDVPLAPWA